MEKGEYMWIQVTRFWTGKQKTNSITKTVLFLKYNFKHYIQLCTVQTSNSLSVTDTTPPRKQVTVNNMVRNCIFAIVTTVQLQVNTW